MNTAESTKLKWRERTILCNVKFVNTTLLILYIRYYFYHSPVVALQCALHPLLFTAKSECQYTWIIPDSAVTAPGNVEPLKLPRELFVLHEISQHSKTSRTSKFRSVFMAVKVRVTDVAAIGAMIPYLCSLLPYCNCCMVPRSHNHGVGDNFVVGETVPQPAKQERIFAKHIVSILYQKNTLGRKRSQTLS